MQDWKLERAREFRRRPTRLEAEVWSLVRRSQLGFRVRRQVPILGWIVDFYVPEKSLVIELDGPFHDPVEDLYRDTTMAEKGLTTIRVSSETPAQRVIDLILAHS